MVLGVAIWSLICCVHVLFLGFHCSLCSLGMCDGYLLPGRESKSAGLGWQRETEVGREKRTEKGFTPRGVVPRSWRCNRVRRSVRRLQ